MEQVTFDIKGVTTNDYLLILNGLRKMIENHNSVPTFLKDLVQDELEQYKQLHETLMFNFLGEKHFNQLQEEGFFQKVGGLA